MLILGIETACDDSAAAVVADGREVRSNVVLSQDRLHERWGGIVPEAAARRQVEVLNRVIAQALDEAGVEASELGAVAVNNQHGLLRSIIVGVSAAKAFAYTLGVPLVGVHHIEAHIFANFLEDPELPTPHVCLTVAGGHSLLVKVPEPGRYELLGKTRDDSAGEVLDKVARHLGLGFPGGRRIQELGESGDRTAYPFPRPMSEGDGLDLSFSGLKEAARRQIEELRRRGEEPRLEDFCASFQWAVVETLVKKTLAAARRHGVPLVTLAGGVASNRPLREELARRAGAEGIEVRHPRPKLCIDNGAMIAGLAFHQLRDRGPSPLDLGAVPSAPIQGQPY